MTVVRAVQQRTNSDLMRDCATLGYLPDDDSLVLDPTYGLGGMWKKWSPPGLMPCDLHPVSEHISRQDFTNLTFMSETFAAVVFDAPYKLNGTSTGKGPSASDARYGVNGEYRSIAAKHSLIMDGMTECERVLAAGGHLLVKCQDQVCSGSVQWQTRIFADHGEQLGLRLVDMLLVPGMRAQPLGRSQKHARRNYSTLLVFLKKPARKRN